MLPRDMIELISVDHIKSPRDLFAFASTCHYWRHGSEKALRIAQRERILRRCQFLLKNEIENLTSELYLHSINRRSVTLYSTFVYICNQSLEYYQQLQREMKTFTTFDEVYDLMKSLHKHAKKKLRDPLNRSAKEANLLYALIVLLREIMIMDFPVAYQAKIATLNAKLDDQKDKHDDIYQQLLLLGMFYIDKMHEISNERVNKIEALIKQSCDNIKHHVYQFVPEHYQSWFAIKYIADVHRQSLNDFDKAAYQAELAKTDNAHHILSPTLRHWRTNHAT